jgi:hypothetical protein
MTARERIAALIEDSENLRDRLLDDGAAPSKEREFEVALAAHIVFVQRATLELATQLDELRQVVKP